MKKLLSIVSTILIAASVSAQGPFESDVFPTSEGELEITFIGHGSLMFSFKDLVIHVDPFGKLADYTMLPKADLIFLTHEHRDHLDPDVIDILRTEDTQLVFTTTCAGQIGAGMIMKNGDRRTVKGISVEAVPAYNLVHKRSNGQPFHPKGVGNGYVLTFGDMRVYVAGDTEDIPEMQTLEKIDIAFLPMNLPYTMTPEMAAQAARSFRPGILYPYHYGETDTSKILELLRDETGIAVRIRKMQ